MFTRHRLTPTNKLDCPHAMGTNAFSRIMIPRLPLRLRSGLRQRRDFGSGLRRPLGASTFCCYHRPIRLLRCAQSLRAGSGCLPRRQADESSSPPWSGCGAVSPQRLKPPIFYVPTARLKPRPFKAESVIAAVNRCATQNQTQNRVFQHSVKPRPTDLTAFVKFVLTAPLS